MQPQAAKRRPERSSERLRNALARREHVHRRRVQRTREGGKAERHHPVTRAGEFGDAAARQPARGGEDVGAGRRLSLGQRGAVQRKRFVKRGAVPEGELSLIHI